jgi:selenocysteine lyase/cysteine desulfurase
MTDWLSVRAEFPAASRYTYLNTAGAPPVSRRAASEAQRYYREMLEQGDLPWLSWLQQVETVRARVAALINADADEIAFTLSSSHAFSLLAQLLGPPGHVVAMRDEFPSGTIPFLQYGDELSFVSSRPDSTIALEDIEGAITPRTRAVVSSSVMYATGFRQDLPTLGTLCRRRGVRLLVDVTQSIGVIPIDVKAEPIDALVFSGYKWTMAGYGVGVMYIARDALRSARVPVAGWWSARDPEAVMNDRLDLKSTAAVLEVGCPHFAGIFALGGSLDLLAEIGAPAVEQRVRELTDYLHDRLTVAGFEIASPREKARRAGITIVRAERASEIVDALAQAGIVVSARGAGIRASLHIFNVERDVDRFVGALQALRRGETLPARPTQSASRVVCVDLNGVLDCYTGWQGEKHWDAPAPGAREFLRGLHEHGWRIIIFTTRHYLDVQRWLSRHGLFEYVSEITDTKPAATVFVDDRAVCHRGDFAATLEQVLGFTAHWEQPVARSQA